jgi:hypothetical protein
MHEARMRRGGSFERRVQVKTISELLGRSSFGMWTVRGEGKPYQRPHSGPGKHPDGPIRTAECVCQCGQVRDIPIHTLKQGNSTHCGCQVPVMVSVLRSEHGMSDTPEYRAWRKMKERCRNPNNKDWPNYGGRGIVVCPEWAADFDAFYAHIGPRPDGMSIDRIDVNGNYEPGNVRWATPREQMQNVRHNRIVTYRGKSMPLIEACRQAGLERRYKAIHTWMTRDGLSFDLAIAREGRVAKAKPGSRSRP